MKKISLAVIAALFVGSASVQAATFNETTDLPNFSSFAPFPPLPNPVSIGLLDAGVNTVTGGLTGECVYVPGDAVADCNGNPMGNIDNSDSFLFNLGAGQQLNFGSIATNVATSLINFQYSVQIRSISSSLTILTFPGGTGGNILAGISSILGEGVYSVSVYGQSAENEQALLPGPYSLSYTLTFGVSGLTPPAAVPLPSSLPLMLMGLAGLGALVRRKRSV